MTVLKSDKGSEYCNEIVKSLCNLLKVEHRQSAPYHSQTIEMLERNHRELNVFLRNYVELPYYMTGTNGFRYTRMRIIPRQVAIIIIHHSNLCMVLIQR
jgi:hypothetical protein